MRTLLHVFPTFAVGGAQMRFVRLANRLGRGYRHLVLGLDGKTACGAHLAPEVEVEMVPPPARGVLPARRLLKALGPELMVTSNWGSMDWVLANLGGGVRHVHMEDGFGPDEAQRQLPRRVWTRRLALRRSTVVLPSETLLRLAREVWCLPERCLVHIPNGIDCDRFAAPPPGPEPVIGTVAALRPEKNLHRLIDAFALVVARRPARLVVVGDGSERASLEDHARRLGVEVSFAGARPDPETLLPSFAVFALSSDTEQMPLSVLEAMAAGRPVAATAVGDVTAMVAPENRPFVVAPSAGALAGALLALLDDPGRAAEIGAANARRARERFDQEAMVRAWRPLFAGVA
jgi:glycosyltransferase involved in cell wall biosynthesis